MKMILPSDIPSELWDNDSLQIPVSLQAAYESLLNKYHLMSKCLEDNRDDEKIYGGRTSEEALLHFAKRYEVSYCRVLSLSIDPKSAFGTIPDDIIKTFSEGRISILDLACGTGAAGASFLTSISTLRKHGKVPKLPLDIYILGADCSPIALSLYSKMIESLDSELRSVGINVTLDTTQWEAEQSYSTSQVFDILFNKPISDEYVIIIANFSGALSGSHYTQCEDSLKHLFDRTSNRKCTIIWVESHINSSNKLFKRLLSLIRENSPWFKSNNEPPFSCDEYFWYNPFLNLRMPCRVIVKKYKRS